MIYVVVWMVAMCATHICGMQTNKLNNRLNTYVITRNDDLLIRTVSSKYAQPIKKLFDGDSSAYMDAYDSYLRSEIINKLTDHDVWAVPTKGFERSIAHYSIAKQRQFWTNLYRSLIVQKNDLEEESHEKAQRFLEKNHTIMACARSHLDALQVHSAGQHFAALAQQKNISLEEKRNHGLALLQRTLNDYTNGPVYANHAYKALIASGAWGYLNELYSATDTELSSVHDGSASMALIARDAGKYADAYKWFKKANQPLQALQATLLSRSPDFAYIAQQAHTKDGCVQEFANTYMPEKNSFALDVLYNAARNTLKNALHAYASVLYGAGLDTQVYDHVSEDLLAELPTKEARAVHALKFKALWRLYDAPKAQKTTLRFFSSYAKKKKYEQKIAQKSELKEQQIKDALYTTIKNNVDVLGSAVLAQYMQPIGSLVLKDYNDTALYSSLAYYCMQNCTGNQKLHLFKYMQEQGTEAQKKELSRRLAHNNSFIAAVDVQKDAQVKAHVALALSYAALDTSDAQTLDPVAHKHILEKIKIYSDYALKNSEIQKSTLYGLLTKTLGDTYAYLFEYAYIADKDRASEVQHCLQKGVQYGSNLACAKILNFTKDQDILIAAQAKSLFEMVAHNSSINFAPEILLILANTYAKGTYIAGKNDTCAAIKRDIKKACKFFETLHASGAMADAALLNYAKLLSQERLHTQAAVYYQEAMKKDVPGAQWEYAFAFMRAGQVMQATHFLKPYYEQHATNMAQADYAQGQQGKYLQLKMPLYYVLRAATLYEQKASVYVIVDELKKMYQKSMQNIDMYNTDTAPYADVPKSVLKKLQKYANRALSTKKADEQTCGAIGMYCKLVRDRAEYRGCSVDSFNYGDLKNYEAYARGFNIAKVGSLYGHLSFVQGVLADYNDVPCMNKIVPSKRRLLYASLDECINQKYAKVDEIDVCVNKTAINYLDSLVKKNDVYADALIRIYYSVAQESCATSPFSMLSEDDYIDPMVYEAITLLKQKKLYYTLQNEALAKNTDPKTLMYLCNLHYMAGLLDQQQKKIFTKDSAVYQNLQKALLYAETLRNLLVESGSDADALRLIDGKINKLLPLLVCSAGVHNDAQAKQKYLDKAKFYRSAK